MIIICRTCGATVGRTQQGRGVVRHWCRLHGLMELAAEDMLNRDEAEELNNLLGGKS